jgi:hypothetical protein
VRVDLNLSPQGSEDVAVVATAETSGTSLSGESIRGTVTRRRGGALRTAIASTPGWMAEDNGLMHYRGSDDGILFVLDGIPV